ncbi:hypothetical protein C8T65DRAFT_676643 [Cerioporus squamosus]|nr:hypothetical protein C8T65DRAFT_676643 [Cerioporus squamosus]
MMSLSPTTSTSNYDDQPNGKRRRTQSFSTNANGSGGRTEMASPPDPSVSSPSHIPKRGARACTNCRKGKNRCEGEAPCRRCQLSGAVCVFEKPEKKNVQALSSASVERLSRLEGQYLVMQSQMIGMQSSLDRILSAIQSQSQNQSPPAIQQPVYPTGSRDSPVLSGPLPPIRTHSEMYNSPQGEGPPVPGPSHRFPALPRRCPHKYATYGIVPSTAPSSDDESEDTLPRSTLNAPIEALQGLANAAAEAAAAPSASPPRDLSRTPKLASSTTCESLLFLLRLPHLHPRLRPFLRHVRGAHGADPLDIRRDPSSRGKDRSGTGPLIPAFYKCLEEAQGIARSSLFGPVVRKEAVQGMLLLAAWSTNGWLPSGHAMRMALDLGLHRALEKLADDGGKKRSDEEERNLVVSARIWLCLYWFDHQMSLGTGRPIVLRDESSIRHCRLLLSHPMASPTDVRLISQVELIAQKTQIYETLSPLNGQVNHNTLAFIRRANIALDKWWTDCDDLHRQTMDEEALPRKILVGELHYAKLWLVCVALRGVSWDKMPFEQRELAFQAKDAASNCLSNLLDSPTYRAALRYAVHDTLVMAAFSGLFLLKMANLFPAELDLSAITIQVEQLAQLLSDVAAERYALTLRIMLANLRRKVGLTAAGMPSLPPGADTAMMGPPSFIDPSIAPPPPFTEQELGPWAHDQRIFNPSSIPLWLQEQSLTDLGLPINGSDGIFLQMGHPNGWMGDFPQIPEAW